ncbi:MAG: cob(I)yrinic acid a,c-diamide adenosyltransferase [Thermoplasmatales archaeon]|nr:cob(I)yrinic acid a,c-diamide adenosyltransferase [Thermoplasmatales archaeon]
MELAAGSAPGAAGGESTTRLYTRTGDDGTTALVGAARVAKDSARIEAYGTFDELASFLGLVEAELPPTLGQLRPLLTRLGHELFLAENELATPPGRDPPGGRITAAHVERIEHDIDEYSGPVQSLRKFVLPGGSPDAARFHVARTIARRAERELWRLHRVEAQPAPLLQWINRLSDLLFALALWSNERQGVRETPVDYTQ